MNPQLSEYTVALIISHMGDQMALQSKKTSGENDNDGKTVMYFNDTSNDNNKKHEKYHHLQPYLTSPSNSSFL